MLVKELSQAPYTRIFKLLKRRLFVRFRIPSTSKRRFGAQKARVHENGSQSGFVF